MASVITLSLRIKINTVPSGTDVALFSFPSGIKFSRYGTVIPLFKGSEWSSPSTIIYGYIAESSIMVHTSDLEINKYISIQYTGY